MTRRRKLTKNFGDGSGETRKLAAEEVDRGDDKGDFNARLRWAIANQDEHEWRHAIKKRTGQVS